jgi:hypothetical protein
MVSANTIVGVGTTAEEALLYARVNQCCIDKGIKDGTISKKTESLEITNKIIELDNSCSKIITAIHFAVGYYQYQNKEYNRDSFTESEYKYFSILIKALGRDLFRKMISVYLDNTSSIAIVINDHDNFYRILY